MTISEFVSDTQLKATGKTTTLATTNTKYTRIVNLGDFYQRRWAREPGVDWNSMYNPAFSLGTVTATDTYDLDSSTVRKLSDRQGDTVRIVWSDGVSYTDYDIVDHNKLRDYSFGVNRESNIGYYCAQMGSSLVFNHTFTTDNSQFGGEILIPCYVFPDEINSDNPDTDEVQVDDPDWLVTRVAAEYVRNDITRQQHYPELLAESNEIMSRMKDDNDGQIDTVDRPWTPGINRNADWYNTNSWY